MSEADHWTGVRGTTRWEHARIMRRVINMDRQQAMEECFIQECEKKPYAMFTHVQHLHDTRQNCDAADEMSFRHGGNTVHQKFVFCSEKHLERFRWSQGWRAQYMIKHFGRAGGDLPTGYRNMS